VISLGPTDALPPSPMPNSWLEALSKITAATAVIAIAGFLLNFVTVKVDGKMDEALRKLSVLEAQARAHDENTEKGARTIERVFNVQLAGCLNATEGLSGARRELGRRRCLSGDPASVSQ